MAAVCRRTCGETRRLQRNAASARQRDMFVQQRLDAGLCRAGRRACWETRLWHLAWAVPSAKLAARAEAIRDLMDWHVGGGHDPRSLDEDRVERFFDHRSQHWAINAGDRAALRRLLSVLRDNGLIALSAPVELTEQQRIVEDFSAYIINDRGLSHSASDAARCSRDASYRRSIRRDHASSRS